MELTYHKVGEIYLPNLESDEMEGQLYQFGRLRQTYLMEHHPGTYDTLLMQGQLMKHLLEIQEQAYEMMDRLIQEMAKQEGITEQLKAQDQMEWVRRMNNIRHTAEEIVLNDLIYQ